MIESTRRIEVEGEGDNHREVRPFDRIEGSAVCRNGSGLKWGRKRDEKSFVFEIGSILLTKISCMDNDFYLAGPGVNPVKLFTAVNFKVS